MFGQNLRQLAGDYPSISELARQLGINRTQFNRYLSGESFPRPDVLDRICNFFGVDARILLEPVDSLRNSGEVLTGPFLRDFFGDGLSSITEEMFPSGFYRFSRRSFTTQDKFVVGLVYIFRQKDHVMLRGFESKEAMRLQGLGPNRLVREFRGFALRQEDGIAILLSRAHAVTASFNFLARVPSLGNNYWAGYVTRTVTESVVSTRAERMVYEYLGKERGEILRAARSAGLCDESDLIPFHRRLLSIGTPFR